MAKLILLDIVQDILNDMDSDYVNSISDTEEALQVAQIVKTTYYEMMSRRDWNHLSKIGLLENVSDSARPNYLKVPSDVGAIGFIMYNRRKDGDTRKYWTEMKYLYPDEFILKLMNRNSDDAGITQVVDFDGVSLSIKNDTPPTYYTSFDDEYAVFDSYNSALETNLQQSMTQCHGAIEPTFSLLDTFIPDFPAKIFPGYLAEAKSTCFNALKQSANQKEEQKSRRQRRKMSRDMRRNEGGGIVYPNYGRK
ncbi:hypothetical protein KAU11_11945 [Candidatus Babeliales bacterium]|nr:hypothetical protein [Candidatus Babeliales bacterium]